MAHVTKMVVTFRRSKPRKKPREGDIKIVKGRKYVRKQRMSEGAYLVSNGRPLFDWVPVNDND
jgi:hypothetical protein